MSAMNYEKLDEPKETQENTEIRTLPKDGADNRNVLLPVVHKFQDDIPGILKLTEIVLNLNFLAEYFPSYDGRKWIDDGRQDWFWLSSGCGLAVSSYLFILHSFNAVNKENKVSQIVDCAYCWSWGIINCLFIFVMGGSMHWLSLFYLVDGYLQFRNFKREKLAEKQIATLSQVITDKINDINPSSPCKKQSYKNMYLESVTGRLKIYEMVFTLLCFSSIIVLNVCLPYYTLYYFEYYCLILCAVSGFAVTGIIVVFNASRAIHVDRKINWKIESILSMIWATLTLIFSTILLIRLLTHDFGYKPIFACYIYTSVLGFVITTFYAADGIIKLHGLAKNITPLGEPKPSDININSKGCCSSFCSCVRKYGWIVAGSLCVTAIVVIIATVCFF